MSFTKNEMQMIEGALDYFIKRSNELKLEEDMSHYDALLTKVKEAAYGSRTNS